MLAFDDHFLADEVSEAVSAFGSWSEREGHFFAFGFDDELLGSCVKGLQFAFVGDDFAATGESGTGDEAHSGCNEEDGFHMDLMVEAELFYSTESKRYSTAF